MAEITKEKALNLAIVLASWHVEWMRLRMKALSLPESETSDFLWKKFPTLQGTKNIITLEKFAALPSNPDDAMATIRAVLAEKESAENV